MTPEPLEDSLLHTLLVNTNRLQLLPIPALVLIMAFNIGLVTVIWWLNDPTAAVILAVAYALANAIDWLLLYRLRQTGRSFGPDKPSALVLALGRALLLGTLGILLAPLWLALALLLPIPLLVYYATWVEPFRLGVTYETYRTDKLKATTTPLRLLHIGDIHMERITPRERDLNQKISELQPDVIVFSGDFVNLSNTDDPRAENAIREIIGEWAAPLGVYCVSGTPLVEPAARVAAFTQGLDNLKWLQNQWLMVTTPGGPLHILGLSVTHDMVKDRALFKKMMLNAPQTGMRLLLMHPPDIAPEANADGIDLYLCGHTHGGQIRLPLIGAIFSSSHLGKRFIMGRYELGTTTVYTSRGVGMEGLGAPRARFLCPPEIILWEIEGTG